MVESETLPELEERWAEIVTQEQAHPQCIEVEVELIDSVKELLRERIQEQAEKHRKGILTAVTKEERDIQDGKLQALIELYMALFDVDWWTAEEIVHPKCEPGDNDPYRDVSQKGGENSGD